MHIIIWEYQVKTEYVTTFEEIYATEGAWAQLFQKHPGYLGTNLLRDATQLQLYRTIDRWVSAQAYNSFQSKWQEEYQELDARCANLTECATLLGTFLPVQLGG